MFDEYPKEYMRKSKVISDKLCCNECNKKLKKGNIALFILEKNNSGKFTIKEYYCESCGDDINEIALEEISFNNAVGIGQE